MVGSDRTAWPFPRRACPRSLGRGRLSSTVDVTLRRDDSADGERTWHVLRLAFGALLLTAALLKAHALATAPLVGSDLFASRWFVLAVVQVELLVGFWLIAGIWPVWAWRSSVALFAVFGVVSLSKALAGEASCGCFGQLTVSPWVTSALNATVVAALVWIHPAPNRRTIISTRRVTACGLVCLLLAGATIAAAASYRPSVLDESGEITGSGRVVTLEPEKWVGKRFPLLRHIDTGRELDRGNWLVVLYKPDCGNCRALLERLAHDGAESDEKGAELAVVEVPTGRGRTDARITLPARAVVGRLDDARTWHVSTPTILRVNDGRVVGVNAGKKQWPGY